MPEEKTEISAGWTSDGVTQENEEDDHPPADGEPEEGEDEARINASIMEDDIDGEPTERGIYVNAEDGLHLDAMDEENRIRQRNLHMQILEGNLDLDGINIEDLLNDDQDFPTNLIVTGLSLEFFEDEALKNRFEGLFQLYGQDALFHYFKSFKRVRVTYESAASAIQARIKMHMSTLDDENTIKCYFGQPPLKSKSKDKDGFLHPPTPDKQFLISPPASPPVDWEPRPETHPNIDYDLISALAKLTPGEPHELHRPEMESHPSIVVHIALDEDGNGIEIDETKPRGAKILPTKRPEI